MSDPIVIAGAGPAGLTAAITLATAGRTVVVHEQYDDVGMRHSDDFQAIENWCFEQDALAHLRTMGVEANFFCRPVRDVSSYGPTARARVRFEEPIAYLTRRGPSPGSLDYGLKEQARRLGVELKFGRRIAEDEAHIVATGPRRARVIAVGALFETSDGESAAVLLDDDVASTGYAYMLTAGGRGTVAVVLYERRRDGKACVQAAMRRFTDVTGAQMRDVRYFGGHGDFSLRGPSGDGGRCHAGEAAGFQDFLFGFGIRYAMLSGHLAALSVLDGASYEARWRRAFGSHLRASLTNRFWYERLGRRGYDALVRASGRARAPRRFWTSLYTRPVFRMLAYPFALRRESRPTDVSLRIGLR